MPFVGIKYVLAGSGFPRLGGATPEAGEPTCYLGKFMTKTALKMKEIGPKGASIPSWICQLTDELVRPMPGPLHRSKCFHFPAILEKN